ncbi:YaiI/YqxD family protein [Reyranella sp. CPCC 100927]|uniref:YaiI/YqxD family protein n=1 Tax=Reyranella sp. CPCC 100927 TaxID=2599616 RepID=UPI0011B48B17|nr:YaiI/YqxD family protein [Reyranella sp. CPCC 100927]TWT11512.1 YaiI/YqxD family protein [Reyranella sp. CPCC 100927]
MSDVSTSPNIAIYIDADACPVKAEAYRVAERYGLRVFVVANAYIAVPRDPRIERVVVGDGFDAADDWIATHAGSGDIVVTADIKLADRCLKAGAAVIGTTGEPFTASSIGMALASRDLMETLRAMGEVTGGPKPMTQRARSRFLSTLDETVQRLRRSSAR